MDVVSLERLINVMFVLSPSFRPRLYVRLHTVLQKVTRNIHDPRHFIDLDGRSSHIVVNHLKLPSSGFTLLFWV